MLSWPASLLTIFPCFLFQFMWQLPLEKIMRNFFWERFAGGKINPLVKWSLVSLLLKDGGLGLVALKPKIQFCLLSGAGNILRKIQLYGGKLFVLSMAKIQSIGSLWENLEIACGALRLTFLEYGG